MILKNLKVFKNKNFFDKRGNFRELLKEKDLKKQFPFIVMSLSKKNVLRGLHIQKRNPQGKFISVIKGKIFDVAIDLRPNSKTYGKHFSSILSEKNCKSIYIPENFAHGFLTLGEENIVVYACTKYRDKNSEQSIIYNDKDLNIKWPIKQKIIISNKDRNAQTFNEFKNLKK